MDRYGMYVWFNLKTQKCLSQLGSFDFPTLNTAATQVLERRRAEVQEFVFPVFPALEIV